MVRVRNVRLAKRQKARRPSHQIETDRKAAPVDPVANTGAKLEKQISFYCTAEFSKLIHTEKVRRGLTIQEMITKALAEYFRRPPAEELRAQEAAFIEKFDRDGRAPAAEWPHYEVQRWLDLGAQYFQRMPRAKRQLLEECMILDLKHYGSSRIKQTD